MPFCALCFILLCDTNCCAASFDERLSSAESYLASAQGTPFAEWTHEHVAPRITPILQKCFGAIENADPTGFMMVADVDPAGKLVNIAVRPSTEISRCVAHMFESEGFEKPPLEKNKVSLPVVFDVGAHAQ